MWLGYCRTPSCRISAAHSSVCGPVESTVHPASVRISTPEPHGPEAYRQPRIVMLHLHSHGRKAPTESFLSPSSSRPPVRPVPLVSQLLTPLDNRQAIALELASASKLRPNHPLGATGGEVTPICATVDQRPLARSKESPPAFQIRQRVLFACHRRPPFGALVHSTP